MQTFTTLVILASAALIYAQHGSRRLRRQSFGSNSGYPPNLSQMMGGGMNSNAYGNGYSGGGYPANGYPGGGYPGQADCAQCPPPRHSYTDTGGQAFNQLSQTYGSSKFPPPEPNLDGEFYNGGQSTKQYGNGFASEFGINELCLRWDGVGQTFDATHSAFQNPGLDPSLALQKLREYQRIFGQATQGIQQCSNCGAQSAEIPRFTRSFTNLSQGFYQICQDIHARFANNLNQFQPILVEFQSPLEAIIRFALSLQLNVMQILSSIHFDVNFLASLGLNLQNVLGQQSHL